ncbi:MAG: plastocyanin/azurin family copper-binding protein [Candidatus Halalkalibacterium sp. M3_1C_030]
MKKLFPLFIFSLALIVSACSGSSDQQQQATEGAEEAETTMEAEGRTIDVYGIDRMKYVVKDTTGGVMVGESVEVNGETYYMLEGISAETGEELTVKLTTISSLPASAMAHNFVLLEGDADAQEFVNASMKAKDNDYIAPNMTDIILAQTEMVGGEESTQVSFSAPETAGDYEYLCSFPGHFAAGMKGILSVE